MNGEEREIRTSLFGGYNKKQTLAYIEELQKLIEELQDSVAELVMENSELQAKLSKAETAYHVLWEKSDGQEKTIENNRQLLELQQAMIAEKDQRLEEMKEARDEYKEAYVILKNLTAQTEQTAYQVSSGRFLGDKEHESRSRFEGTIRKQIGKFSASRKKTGE